MWLFGAHACLRSEAHAAPRGGKRKLVPVVYSPNDIIYFLDADGKAWAQDTIEESRATRYAESGRELVTQIVQQLAAELVPAATPAEPPNPLAGPQVRLMGQKLETLPYPFEQLKELTELDLSINRLTAVPDSLWRAPALRVLDLSHNPLAKLSDAVGQAKELRSLGLRSTALTELPEGLATAKKLEKIYLSGCAKLKVDSVLHVLARLPKLKELSLPLSKSLTTLAPLAGSGLKSLVLAGNGVELAGQIPAGLGQLPKLADLRIEYADAIAQLPRATEDVRALRLLFAKRFSDDDIRKSARAQPENLYLAAYAKTL
jgi:hypothetical protein